MRGKIALKDDKLAESKQLYRQALELCDMTDTETLSVLLSTLAFIDRRLELNDEAIYYYVKTAVNDIRSATKESVSMRGLWPTGDGNMTMQNPYWVNYRNLRENKKDRYMLGASLNYQILDWLNVSGHS